MSNLSNTKIPFQVVLKPSTYQSGNTRGGLNLNKWIPKFLKRIGFAITDDCCTYYPTFPVVDAVTVQSPSDAEMDAADVPIRGVFITVNGDIIYVFMRSVGGVILLGTND